MTETFYTVEDIAEKMRVSVQTVHNWINKGKIVVFREGKVVRISASALADFISNHTGTGSGDELNDQRAILAAA